MPSRVVETTTTATTTPTTTTATATTTKCNAASTCESTPSKTPTKTLKSTKSTTSLSLSPTASTKSKKKVQPTLGCFFTLRNTTTPSRLSDAATASSTSSTAAATASRCSITTTTPTTDVNDTSCGSRSKKSPNPLLKDTNNKGKDASDDEEDVIVVKVVSTPTKYRSSIPTDLTVVNDTNNIDKHANNDDENVAVVSTRISTDTGDEDDDDNTVNHSSPEGDTLSSSTSSPPSSPSSHKSTSPSTSSPLQSSTTTTTKPSPHDDTIARQATKPTTNTTTPSLFRSSPPPPIIPIDIDEEEPTVILDSSTQPSSTSSSSPPRGPTSLFSPPPTRSSHKTNPNNNNNTLTEDVEEPTILMDYEGSNLTSEPRTPSIGKQPTANNDNNIRCIATEDLKKLKKDHNNGSRQHDLTTTTPAVTTTTWKSPTRDMTAQLAAAAAAVETPAAAAPLVGRLAEMVRRYERKAEELIERANGMETESFEPLEVVGEVGRGGVEEEEFPDELVGHLAVLIQGSPLPLSLLSRRCQNNLPGIGCHSIETKIKLISTRTAYLLPPPRKSSEFSVYEDTSPSHLWRWEITSLGILPEKLQAIVKKHRSSRKKISGHYKAIRKLLKGINNDSVVKEGDEEKVLKYERAEEKERLSREMKLMKDKEKERLMKDKEKERQKKHEQKEEEKRLKELQKKQKEEEKQKRERNAQKLKDDLQKKQKARMMSFFKPPTKKATPTPSKTLPPQSSHCDITPLIDSDTHHLPHMFFFSSLSQRAKRSRHRRINYTTVSIPKSSTNPFEQQLQPSSPSLTTLRVRNKHKFLLFFEDHRPPYCGTWSKIPSRRTLPKNPFLKESLLDYTVDSEAEWEEEEQGDDVNMEDGEDQDNEEAEYNFQDGWLREDDDLSDGGEEDGVGRRVRVKRDDCVPVGCMGPTGEREGEGVEDYIERLGGEVLEPWGYNVSLLPPLNTQPTPPTTTTDSSSTTTNTTTLPTIEDKMTFCRFVHGSRLNSRSKLIEQFREEYHPKIPWNRAQTMRILDTVAVKRKGGVGSGASYFVWEVKRKVMEEWGLSDLLEKVVVVVPPQQPPSQEPEAMEIEKKKKVKSPAKKTKVKNKSPGKKLNGCGGEGGKRKRQADAAANSASAHMFKEYLKKSKVEQRPQSQQQQQGG